MVAHPFHIHDVQFYVLDRDGNIPPFHERGRKDVVFVLPNETVRFITKFETFTDTITPYVYHCHILMHEDDGMMGQYLVVPPDFVGINEDFTLTKSIKVYPNPSADVVNIELPESNAAYDFRVIDLSGKVVFSKNNMYSNSIDISELSAGEYHLVLKIDNVFYNSKIIKQ
jgi:bilirubin oxidase